MQERLYTSTLLGAIQVLRNARGVGVYEPALRSVTGGGGGGGRGGGGCW